jgi:hypothetical protein
MTETYYAVGALVTGTGGKTQSADAMKREGQRRTEDPATCGSREPEATSGLTFHELWLRVGGDRGSLWRVLRNEVRRGRIYYHSPSKRYVLNGGLAADVKRALLDLGLADDRR